MWMAHALFWPALAAAHYARDSVLVTVLVFALMLALILTHEGAFILAIAIVASLALRGLRDRAFLRVAAALFVATVIWAAVKLVLPPGAYFSAVYVRAALHFFDIRTLTGELVLLLAGAIVGYGILFLALMRFTPLRAHLYATLIVVGALVIYWLRLDHTIYAGDRYYLRTVLVIATPILGMLAALHAGGGASRLTLPSPLRSYATATITRRALARAIAGGFLLVMLVHTVETAKFVTAWANYKSAVLSLAKGNASDPALGNPLFVSSNRIGPELNRLSWFSTTQYLSVIMAKFAPSRLVVDPTGNYFWFPCKTATANSRANRAVPVESRRIVRTYACLHR